MIWIVERVSLTSELDHCLLDSIMIVVLTLKEDCCLDDPYAAMISKKI